MQQFDRCIARSEIRARIIPSQHEAIPAALDNKSFFPQLRRQTGWNLQVGKFLSEPARSDQNHWPGGLLFVGHNRQFSSAHLPHVMLQFARRRSRVFRRFGSRDNRGLWPSFLHKDETFSRGKPRRVQGEQKQSGKNGRNRTRPRL